MIIKKVRKEIINRIRKNPENSNLRFKDFGKSTDIKEYSDDEISEMFHGIYKSKDHLMVLDDNDIFIDLNDVIKTGCTLEKVSFFRKSTNRELLNITPFTIQTIRTFYVKDYFLITANKVNGSNRHIISHFLRKTGAIKTGRGQFARLFSIGNYYMDLQKFKAGKFPKDLYIPIKTHINQLFFRDDYRINDFVVESEIKFNV
jgi:hypothetical protein